MSTFDLKREFGCGMEEKISPSNSVQPLFEILNYLTEKVQTMNYHGFHKISRLRGFTVILSFSKAVEKKQIFKLLVVTLMKK